MAISESIFLSQKLLQSKYLHKLFKEATVFFLELKNTYAYWMLSFPANISAAESYFKRRTEKALYIIHLPGTFSNSFNYCHFLDVPESQFFFFFFLLLICLFYSYLFLFIFWSLRVAVRGIFRWSWECDRLEKWLKTKTYFSINSQLRRLTYSNGT